MFFFSLPFSAQCLYHCPSSFHSFSKQNGSWPSERHTVRSVAIDSSRNQCLQRLAKLSLPPIIFSTLHTRITPRYLGHITSSCTDIFFRLSLILQPVRRFVARLSSSLSPPSPSSLSLPRPTKKPPSSEHLFLGYDILIFCFFLTLRIRFFLPFAAARIYFIISLTNANKNTITYSSK